MCFQSLDVSAIVTEISNKITFNLKEAHQSALLASDSSSVNFQKGEEKKSLRCEAFQPCQGMIQ